MENPQLLEFEPSHPLYEDTLSLRYNTFFAPYALAKSVTVDELEPKSRHFALLIGEVVTGYARLSLLEPDMFRISQLIVVPEYRGRGFSLILLKHLMQEAKEQHAKEIRLSAQASAKTLYERLGFKTFSDVYTVELTGVPHVRMRYQIES